MAAALQDQVGPDLVGDDEDVILPEQLHGLLQLPFFPDPAAGIVGGAENGCVDLVVDDLLFHVRKVHAHDVIFVGLQKAVDQMIAVILQRLGKADVGRSMDQHVVSPGAEYIEGADDPAQDAVGVADVLLLKALHAVALLLPADDGLIVFLPGIEVAVGRMLHTACDGLRDGGGGGEIHVGHPHGDGVKAVPGGAGGHRIDAQGIYSNGVHAPALQNGSKIIFHGNSPFQFLPPL